MIGICIVARYRRHLLAQQRYCVVLINCTGGNCDRYTFDVIPDVPDLGTTLFSLAVTVNAPKNTSARYSAPHCRSKPCYPQSTDQDRGCQPLRAFLGAQPGV